MPDTIPELDSVVKQYNTYVQYDEIDKDIVRLSKPLKMTEGKVFYLTSIMKLMKSLQKFV